MKHPSFSTLQDYFENELNQIRSELVKDHLLDCDKCTSILSQMAKVDTRFKSAGTMTVPEHLKQRIFSDAKAMLEEKRKQIEEHNQRTKPFDEWMQEMRLLVQQNLIEFKAPTLQLASLTLVIGFVVAANRNEQIVTTKPLSEEVVVYTHSEMSTHDEGESK